MAWRDSETGCRGRRGRTCEVIGLYAAKGYHPSDYRRPWCDLEWIRMIDYDHACQYMQRLADVIFGPRPESQRWAKRMWEQWKSRANGVARVLPSAAALRHHRSLGD